MNCGAKYPSAFNLKSSTTISCGNLFFYWKFSINSDNNSYSVLCRYWRQFNRMPQFGVNLVVSKPCLIMSHVLRSVKEDPHLSYPLGALWGPFRPGGLGPVSVCIQRLQGPHPVATATWRRLPSSIRLASWISIILLYYNEKV